MTIANSSLVVEIRLLTKRPWVGKPKDNWKAARSFHNAFGVAFSSFAQSHWLGKRTPEIAQVKLHKDWVTFVEELDNNTCKIFVLPKGSFAAFLDDYHDGIIQERCS